MLSFNIENGPAYLKIFSGNARKGQAVVIQVDKSGLSEFTQLTNTTGRRAEEMILLPDGQHSAAWVYRAVYVLGNVVDSDWSPSIGIVVSDEASPFASVPAPVELPVAANGAEG